MGDEDKPFSLGLDQLSLAQPTNGSGYGGMNPTSSGQFDIMKLLGIGGNSGGGSGGFKWTPWGSGEGQATGMNFLGSNMPAIGAGINGLSQLGGLYLGIQQLGLAKKSFGLQKEAYKTNLANQTSSYNTQMRDRVTGRSYGTEAERQAALSAALLPTGG